ncbi:hypothetical protein QR680_001243 [Steinernema hermaphroditum]|uniref:Myeloid leukemia factor n=1 Tax=Steinernema hermaphroditum TaxID=289476 RepID=A0AA39GYB3_9BILA|nr:hypothetical protein QR680_001243 [Steinernema hermaphroditum]
MFGGRDPFGDPFDMFGGYNRQMHQMDRMMNQMFMDPFGMLSVRPRRVHPDLMLEEDPRRTSQNRRQVAVHDMEDPMMAMMSPFGFGGGLFGGLMNHMNNIQEHAMNDPHSHVYTSSTFVSYDGSQDGQPHVVRSTMRKAGDATETRRSVHRGGEAEEMSIGHRIGNRSHTIEKKRDAEGRLRTEQKFQNVDDEDAVNFDQEFQQRVRRNFGFEGTDRLAIGDSERRRQRRRERNETAARSGTRSTDGPIITIPDDDEEPARPSSNNRGRESTGVTIQELSDEETDSHGPKRRRRT